MDAKEARLMTIDKLVQYCEKHVRASAENFKANCVVTLNSEMDRGVLKDVYKTLTTRGYTVEERRCYLYIGW